MRLVQLASLGRDRRIGDRRGAWLGQPLPVRTSQCLLGGSRLPARDRNGEGESVLIDPPGDILEATEMPDYELKHGVWTRRFRWRSHGGFPRWCPIAMTQTHGRGRTAGRYAKYSSVSAARRVRIESARPQPHFE
jgi:hypothetical protein